MNFFFLIFFLMSLTTFFHHALLMLLTNLPLSLLLRSYLNVWYICRCLITLIHTCQFDDNTVKLENEKKKKQQTDFNVLTYMYLPNVCNLDFSLYPYLSYVMPMVYKGRKIDERKMHLWYFILVLSFLCPLILPAWIVLNMVICN